MTGNIIVEDQVEQRLVYVDTTVVIEKSMLAKRFMKQLTRDRVVPIISAKVSWEILGIIVPGSPGLLKLAMSRGIRASLFSLELKS